MLDRSVRTCDGLAKDGVALKGKKILGCWPARWKCARLRARAVRAERHAAVAMNNASDSLGHAFEAVLQYAYARLKLTSPAETSSVLQLRAIPVKAISGRTFE